MASFVKSKPIERRILLKRGAAVAAATLSGQLGFGTRSNAMTKEGPFRTLEELGASLASAGISNEDQRMLLDMALPALALQSTAAVDNEIPLGASKLGGAPDLPRHVEWPTRGPTSQGDSELKALAAILAELQARTFAGGDWTEQQYLDGIAKQQREIKAKTELYKAEAPLTFIMQLNLDDIAAVQSVDRDLPNKGRLLVFYDMITRPWFARDADSAPLFRIVHDSTPRAELERRGAPDLGFPLLDFTEDDPRDVPFLRNHMPVARIAPVFTYTIPDNKTQPIYSRHYSIGAEVPQQKWNEVGPAHLDASNRLFGWPESIQNDMRIELALHERNQELPNSNVIKYAGAIEGLMPDAKNWVMLLQIGDYDNDVWDLNGLYYIWIKRQHLQAREFDKAEMIYQTD